MSHPLVIPLRANAAQTQRLHALQSLFAQVCNELSPIARETRCWNRVALHHMSYRAMRDKYPQLGSQMICNAIYSVSRAARAVYQAPGSPFNIARWHGRKLPLIQFDKTAPVYFDRHTLSLKDGQLSMFTLDGRMRFSLQIATDDERRFREEKLQEIVLSGVGDQFRLSFSFISRDGAETEPEVSDAAELPEYVFVQEDIPMPTHPTGNNMTGTQA